VTSFYQPTAKVPDLETLNLLGARPGLYGLQAGLWSPGNVHQLLAPIAGNNQSSLAPTLGLSSSYLRRQLPGAAPDLDALHYYDSVTSPHPNADDGVVLAPEYPSSADEYSGNESTTESMRANPIAETAHTLLPISRAPTWRPAPSLVPAEPDRPVSDSLNQWSINVPDAAQRTSDDRARTNQRIISDALPDNYWVPGADYVADGHHEMPRAHYRKTKMPPETQKVFDDEKTGKLPNIMINGRRHEFDGFHRLYNDATDELLMRFMKENNIPNRFDLMTPDHARAFLKTIAESQDPRIQSYRNFIKLLRLVPWLRGGGRGSE
jgi:hypothetical protein